MKIRKTISGLTSVLVWTLAILLLISLLCAHVNPSFLSLAGVFTLLTPGLILLNIIALIYTVVRSKITGWATFIVLILSIPQIGNLWGFNFIGKNTEDQSFRLMTYNVRNFDLYDWSENEESRASIFKMLQSERPDILCFQEFYSKANSSWNNIRKCKEELQLNEYYFSQELILREGRQWGITTFTRFPIVKYGEIMQIPEANSRGLRPYKGIYTDLSIGNDTIRIINIHLASIYLESEDYTTLENLTEQQDIDIKRSRSIISKLMKAYKKRGMQVKQLQEFLDTENQPHPIIICGDLNDIPSSFAYNRLSKDMEDAWISANWGPGATYNGPIPALRIDQILVDKELEVCATFVVESEYSDHAPLVTTIKLP